MTLRLDRTAPHVPPSPHVRPPVPPIVPREATRVLIVDDEPRLRQVLTRLMARDGFVCSDASDGASALAALEREPVPLVLSDLRMPGMDGLELLRSIRERWPDTAVVMITAVADVEVAVSCLGLGAVDYLTKPFHLEEVRARVQQALEKRGCSSRTAPISASSRSASPSRPAASRRCSWRACTRSPTRSR
jgi:DNA-binding response OmpR family regulator